MLPTPEQMIEIERLEKIIEPYIIYQDFEDDEDVIVGYKEMPVEIMQAIIELEWILQPRTENGEVIR